MGLTSSQRVALYTRWSVYLLLGVMAFSAVLNVVIVEQEHSIGPLAVGVLVAATIASWISCCLAFRVGEARHRGEASRAAGVVWCLLGTGALASGLVLVVVPAQAMTNTQIHGAARAMTVFTVGNLMLCAVSPYFRWRWLSLFSIAIVAGSTAAFLPGIGWEPPEDRPGLLASFFAVALGGLLVSAAASRVTVWMIKVVDELDRTRVVHARLAVAEERLRFSRDLHDVCGRTLSLVAVKSELAAELTARGRAGAADQMRAVHEIAQGALLEVRQVVVGYRTADLTAELAGARSVLRSAGVEATVHEADRHLDPRVQEALAWVVREGTTNVIRHSDATRCTLRLEVEEHRATLTIVNDGVRPRGGVPGTGLTGLRERLAPLGGELSSHTHDDLFTIVASLAPSPEGDVP